MVNVRMGNVVLEALQTEAKKRGVPYTSLLKEWAIEHLRTLGYSLEERVEPEPALEPGVPSSVPEPKRPLPSPVETEIVSVSVPVSPATTSLDDPEFLALLESVGK